MTSPPVTPALNLTTPDRTIPYLTRDQYRCSPTATDTQLLVRGGSQADQDAELDRLIRQASGWCDDCAMQPLTAQVSTETMRVQVGRDGKVRLHPRQFPIVQVNGVSFGYDPANMSALNDLSGAWVENQAVTLPLQVALSSGWTGPLQFGIARPGTRVHVALTYVAGYPVTTLAQPANVGDSTVVVADPTGIIPGTSLRLEQGGAPTVVGSNQAPLVQRYVIVVGVNQTTGTLTLAGSLTAAFAAGAACTALPEEVEQAAVYTTTALIKQAGSGALVMGGGAATLAKGSGDPGAPELAKAAAILAAYRPVAP